jgi:hypothetical protein
MSAALANAAARRIHLPHAPLESAFGNGRFRPLLRHARVPGPADGFVGVSILVNAVGWTQFGG